MLIAVTFVWMMQEPATKVLNDVKIPAAKMVKKDSSNSSSGDETDSSSDDGVGGVI